MYNWIDEMIQVQDTTFTRHQEITSTTLHLVDKRHRQDKEIQQNYKLKITGSCCANTTLAGCPTQYLLILLLLIVL